MMSLNNYEYFQRLSGGVIWFSILLNACFNVYRKLKAVFFYCLISYREEYEYESVNYGLATIDPHSQKERTEMHKIPKFGFNRATFDWDTGI